MKILVLSDSHSGLRFMRECIRWAKPDVVIHLGDHYDDGLALAEENPHLIFHQVAGNCDRYRCPMDAREMLCYSLGGVMTFMTHGHNQHVKLGLGALIAEANRYGAALALYGHTHKAYCKQEDNGMWVMNPGSCGSSGGSAGIVKIQDGQVVACYLITQEDLEHG